MPSLHSITMGQAGSSTRMIDKYAIIPILACAFATIVSPVILASCSTNDFACQFATRPEPRIFWPVLASISVFLAAQNHSRLRFPLPVVCLLTSLAFAGASVLWAYKPEASSIRFSQQAMVITSIILPSMLTARTSDILRGVFLCYALALLLNLFFVFERPPIDLKFGTPGYPGYFSGKNYLGECAAVGFLLSLREILNSGLRRAFGVAVAVVSTILVFLSNSKTAFGLALLVPLLAWIVLTIAKKARVSPLVILLSIPLCYAVLSILLNFNANRLSYMLYGDPTFTGRTIIWEFVNSEIARKELFGWGYQSFWLVGPDAPSILDGPGWVKTMPNAHNGYLDTMLEVGYIGFALLVAFICATLHAIGRLADHDRQRAWMLLSLALFVILYNFLESLWMRGFEFLWVLFLIVVAETSRNWRPLLPTRPPSNNPRAVRAARFSRRKEMHPQGAERRST